MQRCETRARALDRALERPAARAARARLASAETVVVADPDPRVLTALLPFLARLTATGARRTRTQLVLASLDGGWPEWNLPVEGVRVHVHDPLRTICFELGIDGVRVGIGDILRESEAIVLAGIVEQRDPSGLTRLLVPGLASREFHGAGDEARIRTIAARVAEELAVDLVIAFDQHDPELAYCGPLSGMSDASAWS